MANPTRDRRQERRIRLTTLATLAVVLGLAPGLVIWQYARTWMGDARGPSGAPRLSGALWAALAAVPGFYAREVLGHGRDERLILRMPAARTPDPTGPAPATASLVMGETKISARMEAGGEGPLVTIDSDRAPEGLSHFSLTSPGTDVARETLLLSALARRAGIVTGAVAGRRLMMVESGPALTVLVRERPTRALLRRHGIPAGVVLRFGKPHAGGWRSARVMAASADGLPDLDKHGERFRRAVGLLRGLAEGLAPPSAVLDLDRWAVLLALSRLLPGAAPWADIGFMSTEKDERLVPLLAPMADGLGVAVNPTDWLPDPEFRVAYERAVEALSKAVAEGSLDEILRVTDAGTLQVWREERPWLAPWSPGDLRLRARLLRERGPGMGLPPADAQRPTLAVHAYLIQRGPRSAVEIVNASARPVEIGELVLERLDGTRMRRARLAVAAPLRLATGTAERSVIIDLPNDVTWGVDWVVQGHAVVPLTGEQVTFRSVPGAPAMRPSSDTGGL